MAKEKRGVKRNSIQGKKPKLAAANGTGIEVEGEAVLEFMKDGRKCRMKFLDSDVKRPLAAAGEIVEEGDTVVLSQKWGSFIENDTTQDRIPLMKKNGVFVMRLESMEEGGKVKKGNAGMEVDGLIQPIEEEKGVVFRRRMLR